MSYDFILALILIPIMCLFVFFSYRQGLKDGQAIKENKPLKAIAELPKHSIKQTREMKRLNTIMENVNKYNGSSAGQKDVK